MADDDQCVVGPVSSSLTAAARRLMGADLCVRDRIGHRAWEWATERMLLLLQDGEVAYMACPARVPGFGHALLVATDRRLLGNGEHDWTCQATWGDLDSARERSTELDPYDEPTHELVLAACPPFELGHAPLEIRRRFIQTVIRCALDALV